MIIAAIIGSQIKTLNIFLIWELVIGNAIN